MNEESFLTLRYENSKEDLAAHHALIHGDAYRSARSTHYVELTLWSGVLVLAASAAYHADQIFLMFLFLSVMGWHLARSISFHRYYWASMDAWFARMAKKEIQLEVRPDGLLETVDSVKSHVPWKAVKSFVLFRDRLFIELGANLWAIVPRSSARPTSAVLEELIQVLRDRGVKELTGGPGSSKGLKVE